MAKGNGKAGRPEKKAHTQADLDELLEALAERTKRVIHVKNGMRSTGQESLLLDHWTGKDAALDQLREFLDGAMEELRQIAPRGQRPWDDTDY